jgi:hypothetical protein
MTRILAAFVLLLGMTGIAAACPNWQLNGVQSYYTNGQDLWTPNSYNVVAGGNQSLRNCGFSHAGYVISQPDFEFRLDGMESYQSLNIRTSGNCDTILLVNDSTGQWWYDDDGGNGTSSSISINRPASGTWDIWVGTFGSGTCSTTLTLETF